MKNFIKKIILYSLTLIIFGLLTQNLSALGTLDAVPTKTEDKQVSTIATSAGYSTSTDATTIFSRVVQVVLGLSGTVALILIIISGFYYLLSKGDPGKIKKALSYMTTGLIGIALMASAYTLSNYIIKQTQRITGGPLNSSSNTPAAVEVSQTTIQRCRDFNSVPIEANRESTCTNDSNCIYDTINSNCFAKRSIANNSTCTNGDWCVSGYCTGNEGNKKCIDMNSQQNGAVCYDNNDCMSVYCAAFGQGTCSDDGATCRADSDCNGSVCVRGKACLTSPIVQTTFCNYENYRKFDGKTIEYLKQAGDTEFKYCKEGQADRGIFEVLFGGNTSNCGGNSMIAVSYDCYNASQRYDCRICVSDKCSHDSTKSICEASDTLKCLWSASENKCLRRECDNATTEYDVSHEGGSVTKGCRSLSKCSWINGKCVEK